MVLFFFLTDIKQEATSFMKQGFCFLLVCRKDRENEMKPFQVLDHDTQFGHGSPPTSAFGVYLKTRCN